MHEVYSKLKELRLKKGLSQTQMSEMLGLSQNAYSKIENGTTELTIERLEQIAAIFGFKAIDILQPDSDIIRKQNRLLNKYSRTIRRSIRMSKRLNNIAYAVGIDYFTTLSTFYDIVISVYLMNNNKSESNSDSLIQPIAINDFIQKNFKSVIDEYMTENNTKEFEYTLFALWLKDKLDKEKLKLRLNLTTLKKLEIVVDELAQKFK
jgi:transcriptional regulator with XRE-family HTH domain